MTRAIGYVRQSRRKDSEASPESQRTAIEGFCLSQGWDLVGFHEDIGVSGWDVSVQRPGLDAVLADVDQGKAEKVVVRDLSRLSRRGIIEALEIVERLEKVGASLSSVAEPFLDTSSPIGQAVFSLFAAFARQESDLRSEKVKEAKASIRAKDPRFQGGIPPFGFRVEEGRLQVHQVEGPALKAAALAIIDGGSISSQVRALNDAGLHGGRGAAWTVTSLRRTLSSVYLAGWAPGGGDTRTTVRAVLDEGGLPRVVHEALLTEGQWYLLQKILDSRASGRGGSGEPSLLRGLVKCGRCGAALHGDRTKDGGRGRYRCSGEKTRTCSLSVRMDDLDGYVAGWVALYLAALDPDEDEALLEDLGRAFLQDAAGESDLERRAVLDDLAGVGAILERLDDDRADGLLDEARYRRQVTRLQEREASLKEALAALALPPVDVGLLLDPIAAADDGDPGEVLLALPTARAIVGAVLEEVIVDRVGRGGRPGFRPERVRIRPRA
jgi:DNA invertase Pin-like site-specific DNA recombinase